MGGCSSKAAVVHFFLPSENRPGQGAEAVRDFARLRLSKALQNEFYTMFVQATVDGRPVLDLEEFYRFFNIPRTPFAERVFNVMDEDGDGEVTFREFVVCLWQYAQMDYRSLVRFAFDLFDDDCSGFLEVPEIYQLLSEAYGDAYQHNLGLQALMEELDENGDGRVSFVEFQMMHQRHPTMLFPAYFMQQLLRERVLGMHVWEEIMAKRVREGVDNTSTVWEMVDGRAAAAKNLSALELEQLRQMRWTAPYNRPDEYVPTPILSFQGQRNYKVAAIELREHADVQWERVNGKRGKTKQQKMAQQAAVLKGQIKLKARQPLRFKVKTVAAEGKQERMAGATTGASGRAEKALVQATLPRDGGTAVDTRKKGRGAASLENRLRRAMMHQ